MIESAIESVLLPLACAVAILLMPRLPWSTESTQREESWSGSLAVALLVILTLFMLEGTGFTSLAQRWYWISVTAFIIGVGGLFESGRHGTTINSAAIVLGVLVLRIPAFDSLTERVALALIALLGASIIRPLMLRDPVRTPSAIAVSCASLSVVMLAAGSLKFALVAAALAALCTAAALLACVSRTFSAGRSLAIGAVTVSLTLALCGYGYHSESGVALSIFAALWIAPFLLAIPLAGRSARWATVTLTLITLLCAGAAARALYAIEQAEALDQDSSSYTSNTEGQSNES